MEDNDQQVRKLPLLILDEWLMGDISAEELHVLFELTERRSDTTSTIFCIQYSKKDWIKKLGQPGLKCVPVVRN